MSAEWVSVAIQIVLALGVVGAFYVNVTAHKKASTVEKAASTALDTLASKFYAIFNDHGTRITRIETTLGDLPHGRDVHNIALQCANLVGELKELRAEMHAVRDSSRANQNTLNRLETFMLENEGRK